MDAAAQKKLRQIAARLRRNAVHMVAIQGFGYLGQALSSAEIFATLFAGGLIRNGKDRFVLSPGHYAIALYAIAAEVGLLDSRELQTYGADGSRLEAIGTERTPLVDLICGSLGQGLSAAVGFALAAHMSKDERCTYAFLSDGEMEEGQVWEAAMFASHHRDRMNPLRVIIDANNSQVDGSIASVTTIEPLAQKWKSFGWHVHEVDGHDCARLHAALTDTSQGNQPTVVIARTEILGRTRSLPATVDGHFVKLDPSMTRDLLAELAAIAN